MLGPAFLGGFPLKSEEATHDTPNPLVWVWHLHQTQTTANPLARAQYSRSPGWRTILSCRDPAQPAVLTQPGAGGTEGVPGGQEWGARLPGGPAGTHAKRHRQQPRPSPSPSGQRPSLLSGGHWMGAKAWAGAVQRQQEALGSHEGNPRTCRGGRLGEAWHRGVPAEAASAGPTAPQPELRRGRAWARRSRPSPRERSQSAASQPAVSAHHPQVPRSLQGPLPPLTLPAGHRC